MVVLVVATTADPDRTSRCFPSHARLDSGPFVEVGMVSYANGNTRLLKHDRSIVVEDDLDRRWEEATGEPVSRLSFSAATRLSPVDRL
ncbi:hypothetical protein HPP92_003723 [Vanilla planifolia]|uniref:Uncharacterized protein n=1 Tax=Vanilla planifolia TaxID=51239 RepID=A0A835S7Q0_VANPL|nr:hypothetical protein HPP92_003723 [Vanilla planifolia]